MDRKALVIKRATYKRKITVLLNAIEDGSQDYSANSKIIENCSIEIQNLDSRINEILYVDDFDEDDCEELDIQTEYLSSTYGKLHDLSNVNHSNSANVKPEVNREPKMASNCEIKLPNLECETFSGEGTSYLNYHSFKTSFNNIIGHRDNLSASAKLTYLKSYLRGYASKLIAHLQVNNSNYETAIDLLDSEFFNKKAIVSDLLAKFLNLKPKFDESFLGTKLYLNEVRCVVSDLRTYEYDFLVDNPGNLLISHLVFSRLPNLFKQEFVRKTGDNYPGLSNLFENYSEVIHTLNLRKPFKSN